MSHQETKQVTPQVEISDIKRIAPKIYKAMQLKEYPQHKGFLEYQGDITEIMVLVKRDIQWTTASFDFGNRSTNTTGFQESPIETFLKFYKWTQACWGQISFEEWRQLAPTKFWEERFPLLTRLSEIHAWG